MLCHLLAALMPYQHHIGAVPEKNIHNFLVENRPNNTLLTHIGGILDIQDMLDASKTPGKSLGAIKDSKITRHR